MYSSPAITSYRMLSTGSFMYSSYVQTPPAGG